MKKIYSLLFVAVALLSATSCLKDLDTLPLNLTDPISETAYADENSYLMGLAYVNAYWAFVSQTDPGSADISAPDAGQSELLRQFLNLQEMSTDSFKCTWGDSYVADLCADSWTPTNTAVTIVYTRLLKGIALANEYLLQTEDDRLDARGHGALKETVHGYRAEARFHRALFFWALMDLYGNPPFPMPENIGGELPPQKSRAELFDWLETELTDLLAEGSDMPKKGEVSYPRPTQGSVAALLARMYLNAQVYTGTARWQDAKDMAAKVIGMGYKLHPSYEELFMQDNTENGAAADEFIFGIDYDKDHSQSWGGTTTYASAFFDKSRAIVAYLLGYDYGSTIVPEEWNGYHVSNEYVSYFNLKGISWNDPDAGYTYNNPDLEDFNGDGTVDDKDNEARAKQAEDLPGYTFGYDREASDKRAFFINQGIPAFDNSKTESGWRCWKFSGRYTDGHLNDQSFSSMDFPIFRLAEMYLIYAEADARLNGGKVSSSEAKGYIKALRDRAGVATPADDELTLDWLLAERARELMLEGQRRTDLIRYGYFTSASFPWPYKGGVPEGRVAIPAFRTIYPIIDADLNANTNLVQNPGY
ncbi:MAG: RagB/SusD family nutrient uptake outer membrane protein [Bacteroidales bacterium]|nr:RagB/SusD family nutrient uptake outer membrane protein [Bacteroidales bacterium]